MPRFSQRHGHSALEMAFQRESVDSALRTKLWNALKVILWDGYNSNSYSARERSSHIDQMVRRLWVNYFNRDLDALPPFHTEYGRTGYYDVLKDHFARCKWFEVYDFLEEISVDRSGLLEKQNDVYRNWINEILEEHNSAYRYVGKEIAEITDFNEISAIERGLEDSENHTRIHLESALRMLSDRESPDYRNSIKESISAVESACRAATGDSSATLGDALKKVKNMHPAMQKAFGQLYGYTSDASGIRHALVDEPTISYADAKFMLVACSAFISFLKLSAANV